MSRVFKYLFLLFFCMQFAVTGFSQKETEKWYLNQFLSNPGQASALDFSAGSPVLINNNAMLTGWEGCASISDASGNLLFYTQGLNLYNKNHAITPNGSNLLGNNSVTQVAVFVPKPGNPNIYYLFILGDPTGNAASSFSPWTLYYNEVDVTMNGGLGDITANKNVLIAGTAGNSSEKMSVTRHCNGTDYWLVIHTNTGNTFKAFQISAAGISATPVVSSAGTTFVIGGSGNDSQGQMKFSPNGTKLALALKETHMVELFDFNKLTGVVSNAVNLGSFTVESYGIEFSPDNSILYSSMSDPGGATPFLMQWFLCTSAPAASMNTFSTALMYSLQLATDGKIYGCTYYMNGATSKLSVINNPNVFGAGCNFSPNGPSISPYTCGLGLPNFVSSYFDMPGTFSYATATQVNATNCLNNGSATVSICPTLGAAPYTYMWSNGTVIGPTSGLTSTISGLGSGTYSVVISDATCMKDTALFTITGNSFSVTPSSTATACGSSNGTASVSVSSGTPPYTYLWNPTAQTSSAVSGLASGNYSVTITDNTGCSQTMIVNVPSSGGGSVTITSQNSSCSGANNGSASATMSSGTSPYTYSWTGGQSTQTITGLTPGNYTCTVTDAGGCSSTQTVSVMQPTAITTSVSATPSSCGQSTGTATVAAAGGSGSYTYLWTPTAAATATATGLVAGTYSVLISDSNGCTQTATVAVANANGPAATVTSTNASCSGINNGTAAASATAGTAPYTYLWSNGASTSSATGLAAGNYSVVVTDAGGCTTSTVVTVSNGPGLSASISANVSINGGSSANLSASGGNSYSWSPAAGLSCTNCSNPVATPGITTQYCVVVTDLNGCTDSACVTVFIIPEPIACGEKEFYLPNAFSPNGDGENDVFVNYIDPACISEYRLAVYSRWGEKVFETEDVIQGWDGMVKGKMSNPALYIFYCRAILISGDEILKEGNVSLIR